jgi:peptide chain release factor 1
MVEFKALEEEYRQLNDFLSKPESIKDIKTYQKKAKRRVVLEPIIVKIDELKKVHARIHENEEIIKGEDQELKEIAQEELEDLRLEAERLQDEIYDMIYADESGENKNAIMEIRAGTGGDESTLFAADLFRMYTKYIQSLGWKIEIMNSHSTEIGGFKEIIFLVEGDGAFGKLKYESGTHRVQRIPVTESSGRIHTSAATVAVLPEAEEVEVNIDPNDLKIDVFRSSGPGGQSVNTTDSAVRITHLPTGLVVSCQDERSQHKNKAKALKVLRAKLLDIKKREQKESMDLERRRQVGSGDRSEKIRTYNFPQRRVTDHRIGLTLYRLEDIMNGDLEEIISALKKAEREENLKKLQAKAV